MVSIKFRYVFRWTISFSPFLVPPKEATMKIWKWIAIPSQLQIVSQEVSKLSWDSAFYVTSFPPETIAMDLLFFEWVKMTITFTFLSRFPIPTDLPLSFGNSPRTGPYFSSFFPSWTLIRYSLTEAWGARGATANNSTTHHENSGGRWGGWMDIGEQQSFSSRTVAFITAIKWNSETIN